MAKNIRYTTDDRMVIEGVGANYSAGDFIVQGILHGVSINNVASGADAVVQAVGEVEYAKTAGETWTEGEDLYYDAASDAFTTAITTDGIVRGVAAEDAPIDATSGLVKLVPGRMAADADFVAYDNGTSGLAATTVQDAIDGLVTAVDGVVYDDDARLTDARTPTAHKSTHATAGSDALSAADIGAAAETHASQHFTAGDDAIAPADIGAATADHTHDAVDIAYDNDAVPAIVDIGGAMDAVIDYIRQLPKVKRITVLSSSATGTSDGDTTLAGGAVQSIVPVSGVDKFPIACAIDGTTGVITLTLAAASTDEATFDVWVKPVLPAT